MPAVHVNKKVTKALTKKKIIVIVCISGYNCGQLITHEIIIIEVKS